VEPGCRRDRNLSLPTGDLCAGIACWGAAALIGSGGGDESPDGSAAVTGGCAGPGRRGAGPDDRRRTAGRPGAPEPERQRWLAAGLGLGSVRGGGLCGGLAEAGQPAWLDHPGDGGLFCAERGCQFLRGGRLPAPAWRAAARLGGAARAAGLGAGNRVVRAGRPAISRRPAAVTAPAVGGMGLRRGGPAVDRQCRHHHGGRHPRPPHPGGFRREPAAPEQHIPPIPGLVECAVHRGLGAGGGLLAGVAGSPGAQLPALVRGTPPAAEVVDGRISCCLGQLPDRIHQPGRRARRFHCPGRVPRDPAEHRCGGHEVPAVRHRRRDQQGRPVRVAGRVHHRRLRRPWSSA
jgi:hypothetical protein